MYKNLIKDYINKISIIDVKAFCVNNNIELNDNEIVFVFECLKTDYETLIYGDSKSILDKLKANINIDAYNKLKDLFYNTLKKYKNFI